MRTMYLQRVTSEFLSYLHRTVLRLFLAVIFYVQVDDYIAERHSKQPRRRGIRTKNFVFGTDLLLRTSRGQVMKEAFYLPFILYIQ